MAEPGLALCSMATSPSASAAGSFALSVQTFERGRHLFLGADAEGAAAVRPLHRSYNGTCDPFIFHALGQNTKQQLLGKARATLAAATSMQPPPPPPMLALPAGLNTAQAAGTHGRALVL